MGEERVGSFGKVFKGLHKITKEIRAIKSIDKANVDQEAEAKLFEEIAILKELVLSFFALILSFRITLIL